jgi:dTDP-4-dehydrorhamnose 3,5-epimerase
MQIRQLAFDGVYIVSPTISSDDRGVFLELFSQPVFQQVVGHQLSVAQINCALSRRGSIRGIHSTALPPGQSKYIACISGAIIDIVVDIRVGSPTYGESISVQLDAEKRQVLYLAEGHGHGIAPLTEEATFVYLCSSTYSPDQQIVINPLDPELALPWPPAEKFTLSEQDKNAPTLSQAKRLGILPAYSDCLARYNEFCAAAPSLSPRVRVDRG